MKKVNPPCQYDDPKGIVCQEKANESGYCYWHDQTLDKSGDDVKQALVDYVSAGGLTRGICLKNTNLSHIDLVNHHKQNGYDFCLTSDGN